MKKALIALILLLSLFQIYSSDNFFLDYTIIGTFIPSYEFTYRVGSRGAFTTITGDRCSIVFNDNDTRVEAKTINFEIWDRSLWLIKTEEASKGQVYISLSTKNVDPAFTNFAITDLTVFTNNLVKITKENDRIRVSYPNGDNAIQIDRRNQRTIIASFKVSWDAGGDEPGYYHATLVMNILSS